MMKSLAEILANISEKDTGKYLKHEWQLFGYKLAVWLGDTKRMSYYMKLAKNENRVVIQNAWDFVKESKANSKAGLFLWKLKQLKEEKALKDKEKLAAAESANLGLFPEQPKVDESTTKK